MEKRPREVFNAIDSEMDRYNEAKSNRWTEALIKQYKREITNLERDIANQKKKQQSAIAKKKKLRQAAKKLNDRLGVIAASKALDAAQQAKRAKDKLKQVKAQIKEAQAQEKAATNSVRRLENEQRRVRMEIGAEQQALEDFRDELDVRDEDIYNEEKQLQIRNINQMVYVTETSSECVRTNHVQPSRICKGPRANLIAVEEHTKVIHFFARTWCSSNEYYRCSNEAIRCFHGWRVEVFAFAETAGKYTSSMMDLMQDFTEKANRAATALKGIRGIKISPYQEVAFALAVRDHYETEEEPVMLHGLGYPSSNRQLRQISRGKFIANAEDKSGTTTDGFERIVNAERAMPSVVLNWYGTRTPTNSTMRSLAKLIWKQKLHWTKKSAVMVEFVARLSQGSAHGHYCKCITR